MRRVATSSMILVLATPICAGQASVQPRVLGDGGGVVVIPDDPLLNPDSPEARAYAALQREKRAVERELRLIQRRHFGRVRDVERREIGLRKLREHTSPAALLVMTELFEEESDDVRAAVLDHFSTIETEEAEAALAWEAVHGRDEWYRAAAREILLERRGVGEASPRVRAVIADGLTGEDDTAAVAAGRAASTLRLFEFIPMMASAQVAAGGGGGDRQGDLGYIFVGTQTSFVADLIPVVGNDAVGLDPQIAVVSEGTMLRVTDAVVLVYRTELFETLVEMTSDAWGRSTRSLGYDATKWHDWYGEEFVPYLEAKASAAHDDADEAP